MPGDAKDSTAKGRRQRLMEVMISMKIHQDLQISFHSSELLLAPVFSTCFLSIFMKFINFQFADPFQKWHLFQATVPPGPAAKHRRADVAVSSEEFQQQKQGGFK